MTTQVVISSGTLMSKRVEWIGALILAAVSYLTYYPGLRMGFYLDDYVYLERAGRTDWSNALTQIFDPRVQTQWYRPLQAIQFFLQFHIFGGDSNIYHVINISFHAVNVLLLYALVWRLSQKWMIGFAGAFFYATISVYPSAINWVGIVDPLNTMFYLATIWFWLTYLEHEDWQHYALAFAAFVLALLSKQISVTIPVVLLLIEWLVLQKPFSIPGLVRRYGLFVFGAIAFSLLQYMTQSTHTFASVFGWQFGASMAWILLQYLVLFFFPWGVFPSIDLNAVEAGILPTYVWLAVGLVVISIVAWRSRSRVLLFLAAFALLNLLPVLPFPFIEHRYLYLPIMAAAVMLALLFDQARHFFVKRVRFAPAAASVLALLALGNGLSINDSALSAAEWARQLRVPFRDIMRQHPTFPQDTLLYFIDPITPTTGGLSGMAMVQYGAGVWVRNWTEYADLNKHNAAYVYYFDETRAPREIPVEKEAATRISLPLPIDFDAPIRLIGYEVPRVTIKRGDPIALILYWQAMSKIDKDYTMFAHLVAPDGNIAAQYNNRPRKGALPTTVWGPDHYVADSILIPINSGVATGSGYKIEIGWYDSATQQRLAVIDSRDQPATDVVMVEPFDIVQ